MTKRVFEKIMNGLKDALEGRWARATVYSDGKPVQRYTNCAGCGGLTLTVHGRCDLCGDRKITAQSSGQ